MVVSGVDKVKQQRQDQLARTAEISMAVRQAVRKSLPAPPEQFFTMMVPGKVLNFDVGPVARPSRLGCSCGICYPIGFHRWL
jgi:hypothetical protein